MPITLKTHKMLWGRAAHRCAFPGCRKELVSDKTQTDDESLVGEACHIVARATNGPRGYSNLTSEQRDKYQNLILLCNVHHKIVDDQVNHYTVDMLTQMKNDHELWVQSKLDGYDKKQQRDDEIYVSYLETFENLIELDNWNSWISCIFDSGQPQMPKKIKFKLDELIKWLFSRVWPGRYPQLENSFENFQRILQDFINVFNEHAVEFGEHSLSTDKFYRIDKWDPVTYDRLAKEYDYHCYLVEDLALELNRAVNYIFDMVRLYLIYSYRLDIGAVFVTSGPRMDLSFEHLKAQYPENQKIDIPYPGLEIFKDSTRFERDFWFGDKT
ncbi:HNH endonuclease [uncultured Desulfobacter sp.]|uniref:HNH endonuclease n=1 Tax=uncultured Desulfobacter sp. TaxID=240139 RepID=UPI0029F4C69C|nr:HNH endonuclease [uncultured Desulfobacter sp.]